MKKIVIAVFIFLAVSANAHAGGLSLGPSPWIGNTTDGLMKGIGLETYYYAWDNLGLGVTAGWLQVEYPVEDSTYRISYLPAAFGCRYHFLEEAFNRYASLMAGAGFIYNIHLSGARSDGADLDMAWESPLNLYLQLGIKTAEEFSSSYYIDFFIQYNRALTEFGSSDSTGVSRTYTMDLVIISIGAGINIGFSG